MPLGCFLGVQVPQSRCLKHLDWGLAPFAPSFPSVFLLDLVCSIVHDDDVLTHRIIKAMHQSGPRKRERERDMFLLCFCMSVSYA